MQRHHKGALVLNADYMPLGLITWQRAITLVIVNEENPNKGLQPIDFYKNDFIKCTGGIKRPIPAVVRIPNYVHQKRRRIPFSRKNVFIRDQITCQYCGKFDGTTYALTYDHVIPRAVWKRKKIEGTPTNWTNIVTCCIQCNRRKADRIPEEADMTLIKTPREPNPRQYILGLSPWTRVPREWEVYLTPIYKNILVLEDNKEGD